MIPGKENDFYIKFILLKTRPKNITNYKTSFYIYICRYFNIGLPTGTITFPKKLFRYFAANT